MYIKLSEYNGYLHLISTMVASFLVLKEHIDKQNKYEKYLHERIEEIK